MASSKNIAISGAATDLGMGDSLKTQVEDEEEIRKKKLAQQASGVMGGQGVLGAATSTLFGGQFSA